ncbi:PAS domain S-box protein [Methylobacterium fujisawaense]|uniref:PAS domain S-box protein n=1 Tax=Methylobacterium fujisawaense TaxID=107400 RepID=UPI00313C3D84
MDAEDLSEWPPGLGEMAGRIRAHDWASTPLGPVETWSDRLRVMIEQVLASPMVSSLVCGMERLLIYNDAAARLFGDRHPEALGRPLPETFPEGWVTVASFYERAFAGESVTVSGQPLDTRGDGRPVPDVFDAYLMPVREGPAVSYVHMVGFEIGNSARANARLLESEDRQAFLLGVSDALRPLIDAAAIQGRACRMLGQRLQAERAYYVEVDQARDIAIIEQDYTRDGAQSLVGVLPLSSFRWVIPLYEQGHSIVVTDVATSDLVPDADRHAMIAVGIVAWIALPLIKHGELVGALCVAQARPRNWTEAEVVLAQATGERIWAAVERARTEAALRESEERHAFLLNLSDALRPLMDPADIAEVASRRLGERLGVNRVCYAQIEGEHLHIRREYVRGVPSSVGEHSIAKLGRDFLLAYRPGELVTSADVVSDPRFDDSGRSELLGRSIAAFADMVLPDQEWGVSLLVVQNATPRNWTEAETHLIREVGRRVRAATARARTETALRDSEERFAQFAASSSDALWIRDAATLVMEYTSPAIQRIYGIGPDAILGDVERWAALILPEDRDTARRHLVRAQAGEAVTHEFRIRHSADGEVRWIKNTDFPLRDADGRVQRIGGIAEDVTEIVRSAKRQEVLVNELQHRARNLLGVVSAVADRTLKQGGRVETFEDRLQALSRAQGLLSQGVSDTVEVGDLVRAELAAHTDAACDCVTVSGPTVYLTARQVQNFALALHELTTNAVKYGALKDGAGQLAVTWDVVLDRRERRRLALNWTESGVDVRQGVTTRRGYGTELIQEALAYALQAEVEYVLGEDGVRCRIEMPVS